MAKAKKSYSSTTLSAAREALAKAAALGQQAAVEAAEEEHVANEQAAYWADAAVAAQDRAAEAQALVKAAT